MCYGSGSWCLSTWKVSLVMLRAVETFWEIFRICKTPGFLQHSWRLSIGDSYMNLGFNTYTVFSATRALGMPFPLAIAATGMIVDGVFDRFPQLRVGFMEGGTAWIPLVIDRLEREVAYGG